jgi:hypothetical protein
MTTITLNPGKFYISELLAPEIADRISEYHADVVQPKILGAITSRYNGQKPKKVLRNLNKEEKALLAEARGSFGGNLLALQEKYLNKTLEDPNGSYQHNQELAENAVKVSILEGIMQYEHRHGVKLLDRIARFQSITGKDFLEQTK